MTMYKFFNAAVWKWKHNEEPITIRTDQALLLYTEERAYIDFERKRKLLNSKLLLYVQPESIITITPACGKATIVIGVAFQAYMLEQQEKERLIYRLDYSMLPNNGFVLKPLAQRTPALIRELVQQSMQNIQDTYICDRNLNELVQQIIRQMNSVALHRTTAEQAVAETIQSMLAHYEWNWTRDEAARSKQFNVSHFSRAFQHASSYSFSALLGKIRLNQARILLLTSDMTLDQIAHRTGFISGLYLSRRFKQDCGLSPTSYRTMLKDKKLRIATMQQAGDWLALGIVPVAASFAPWHTSPLFHEMLLEEGTVSIYELEDIELLAGQQPDLIVIPDYVLIQNASRLRQLEQIAPVLFFSSYQYDNMARLSLLAKLVDRRAEALQWQERYQLMAGQWRRRLQQIIAPTETAACYELRGERHIIVWFNGSRSSYNFYKALELRLPDELEQSRQNNDNYMMIELEQLPQFAADHMFLIQQCAESTEQLYHMLQASSHWSSLPALQNKNIYPLTLQQFWSDDAAALEQQLPVIVQSAEAVRSWAASQSMS